MGNLNTEKEITIKETSYNNSMNQYIWINENGDKAYYSDKEMKIRHRVDGPAVEYKHGDEQWYRDGKLHREDGPAKVSTDQYLDNSFHVVDHPTKTKCWCLHGKLHRTDGPAIEYYNGDKAWYLNDRLHRVDGPALEINNGAKYWYLNGEFVTKQKHALLTKKESTININGKEFTIEELNALIETAKGNKL